MKTKLSGTFLIAVLAVFLFTAALPAVAQTGNKPAELQWVLVQSTLTYHVSSPVHQVYGTSRAAKGKGYCSGGWCNFLIAAPVKSFTTGDTNRDLHMLEATRGADFPMVVVQAHFRQSQLNSATIDVDLEVQFGGQKAHYAQVPFERTQKGSAVEIKGTVPATCSDFKISRPSFLGMTIANAIPVHVDMTWRSM
jgi:hypothetical protein